MADNGMPVTAFSFRRFTAITKSDATVYSPPLDGLYIGGVGDVNVVDIYGTTTLFKAVPTGTQLYIQVKQVLSANTTATNVVGLQYA